MLQVHTGKLRGKTTLAYQKRFSEDDFLLSLMKKCTRIEYVSLKRQEKRGTSKYDKPPWTHTWQSQVEFSSQAYS